MANNAVEVVERCIHKVVVVICNQPLVQENCTLVMVVVESYMCRAHKKQQPLLP